MPDPLTVVLFSGIGAHVLWLGLLPEIRRRTDVTVVCAPEMEGLVRLYEGRSYDALRVERVPEATIERLRQEPVGGTVLAWHGAWKGDELAYLRARGGGTIADVIRDIMAAPDAEIVAPEWKSRAWVDNPGRTVMLAPFAHTAMATLPPGWWAAAADHLTAIGLTVVTNVANRARGFDHSRGGPVLPAVPGTIPVDIPLSEIGPFAERCGFVLCARSGLSDLLARANTRMTVVWPRDPAHADYHARHFAAWSVRRIYGGDTREVWVDKGAEFDPGVWRG